MARSKPWKPTPVPTPAPTPTPTSCTDDDGTFQALETNPGGYTCAQVKQAGALDCSTAAVLCCTSCSGSAGSGNSAPTPTPVPTPAPTPTPTSCTDDDGTFQALETNPGGYTCAQVKQA